MSEGRATDPRVSILMLTYNRPQRIGKAIASALAQSFQDWELIIVQDGLNPETQELLSGWLAKEPRIRYFPRGTVGSIAEASNFGLAQARGEYVAILDDDDEWCGTDKLSSQVDFLDRSPDFVGCGGGYIVIDQDGEERRRFLKPETNSAIRARALLANPVVNSTAVFRRVVNGKPALYDTSMRQFADWDFWLSMGEAGQLYNFPSYLAHYCLWEGGSSFRHQKANGRAAIRIVRKHRHHYGGFPTALGLAYLYYLYACLPAWFRRFSYGRVSALKKGLASSKKAPAPPA
jgi:glycosyltransferase involved in cell wall biosynthesis